MPDPTLEAALDELYGCDPSDFVAVRKRLAAALGADGEKEAAKELRAARRPSTSAWALNQLARLRPDVVSELLDQSASLVAAQTRALSGKPDALRAAIQAHRTALTTATDAALAMLGTRSNDAFRAEIVSTLRAASTDEEVGRQLRAGRLVREASSSGFPDATGLTLVAEPPRPTARSTPKRATPPIEVAHADATRTRGLDERKEREREAPRQAARVATRAARREVAAAERETTRARTRIERLEHELEAAQRELESALARTVRARSAVDRVSPGP